MNHRNILASNNKNNCLQIVLHSTNKFSPTLRNDFFSPRQLRRFVVTQIPSQLWETRRIKKKTIWYKRSKRTCSISRLPYRHRRALNLWEAFSRVQRVPFLPSPFARVCVCAIIYVCVPFADALSFSLRTRISLFLHREQPTSTPLRQQRPA